MKKENLILFGVIGVIVVLGVAIYVKNKDTNPKGSQKTDAKQKDIESLMAKIDKAAK